MNPNMPCGALACMALACLTVMPRSARMQAASGRVSPAAMGRIATVDERFQSYNVEMVEVVGGRFWKPYASGAVAPQPPAPRANAGEPGPVGLDPNLFEQRTAIDLSNPRLRTLATALGPAYVRVSGTWANSIYFHDSDDAPPAAAPKGFQSVLTRHAWAGVIQFANAVNARLVSSFAITEGTRDPNGAWTTDQAARWLAYTKSAGGEIAAAEFFNEPTLAAIGGAPRGYDAAAFARDFAVFQKFARATAPNMLIAGPGSVAEGVWLGSGSLPGMLKTMDLLGATPRPAFDIFSYHFYGAVSMRCAPPGGQMAGTTPDAALSDEWLSRSGTVYAFYAALRDQFSPGTPMWLTETADAACGGNPWGATFLDTFRYVDQLGRLATRGVKTVFHNTLAASEYGLIDEHSMTPRPNYWAAVLWHRLMGATVLDAGASKPGLHVYAHCLPGHRGGVTLLAINTTRTSAESIDLPITADRYSLAAGNTDFTQATLNGRELVMQPNGLLPTLNGARIVAGPVELAPASITFLAMAEAGNPSCR
jgi:heparanase